MIYRFKDEYKEQGLAIGAENPSSLLAMLLYWPMTEEEYNLLPAHVKECCIGLEYPEDRQALEGMFSYIIRNRRGKALDALKANGIEKEICSITAVYDTTKILLKYFHVCNHKCTGVGKRIQRDHPNNERKRFTYIEDFEDYSEDIQKTSLYKEINGICCLVKDDKVFYEFGPKFSNLILRERFSKEVLEKLNDVIPSPEQQCHIF